MEKKNSLILSVVAVATLLVAVAGATFAYFTNRNTDTLNTANVSVTADQGASTFTGQFSKTSVAFDIGIAKMQQGTSTTGDSTGKTDNVTLNVSLKSANNTTTTTCTYNIVYTWNGTKNTYSTVNDYYYKKSANLESGDKEFTYTVTASGATGTKTKSETQFADAGTAAVTLISSASIASSSSSSASTQAYTITFKFYNHPTKDQSEQKGKKFTGQLSMTGVNCTYA